MANRQKKQPHTCKATSHNKNSQEQARDTKQRKQKERVGCHGQGAQQVKGGGLEQEDGQTKGRGRLVIVVRARGQPLKEKDEYGGNIKQD